MGPTNQAIYLRIDAEPSPKNKTGPIYNIQEGNNCIHDSLGIRIQDRNVGGLVNGMQPRLTTVNWKVSVNIRVNMNVREI
jgi:hypothetical protein